MAAYKVLHFECMADSNPMRVGMSHDLICFSIDDSDND